ncbi:MAG: hypothetical protein QOD76_1788 [Solirubrobacteraceae bacterium]|jgi:hypothetical protein|nr:hypothetical protein [Solirubrobacteraceae bacterium]
MRGVPVILAAVGAAATLAPLDRSDASTGQSSSAPAFRDRVITRSASGPQARAAQGSRRYFTPDGLGVQVTISSSYPDDANTRARVQSYVDFLSSRVHGSELGRLSMFIGTRREVADACGGSDVLACYADFETRMYVPLDGPSRIGPYTREYILTHELGHHIAHFRRNDPFNASEYGAKYWSSYKHTCYRVERRILFVNASFRHYLEDAGEGWADGYAHLHYPNVEWQFSPLTRPDAGTYAAIRRDVLQPWSGPRSRTFRGSLRGGRRASSTLLRQSLDGTVNLRLSGPSGADFQIEILKGSRVLARTRGAGSGDSVNLLYCRPPSESVAKLRLRVRRLSGAGSFALRIRYPG